MHGRALSKSFLVYKRIMDGNMANHCSARSKGNLRPCQIVDIEFELLDVEMTLSLWQRFWLKEPARRHLCVNTFCRRIGCPRWVLRNCANRLKLLRKHLSRLQKQLTPDSASTPPKSETDQILREARASAPGPPKPNVPPLCGCSACHVAQPVAGSGLWCCGGG